jgi:hypothetical protein
MANITLRIPMLSGGGLFKVVACAVYLPAIDDSAQRNN